MHELQSVRGVTTDIRCRQDSAHRSERKFVNKLVWAAVLSSIASIGSSVPPSLAQELPSQPATPVRPLSPVKLPTNPKFPTTTIDPETNYRSIAITCGNKVSYKLTTGSSEGACKLFVDHGKVTGAFCTDGANSALQACSIGCQETTGSGGCTRQDQAR